MTKLEQLGLAQSEFRDRLTATQGNQGNSNKLKETLNQTLNHMNSLMLTSPTPEEEL